jgi:hypothetical protein
VSVDTTYEVLRCESTLETVISTHASFDEAVAEADRLAEILPGTYEVGWAETSTEFSTEYRRES